MFLKMIVINIFKNCIYYFCEFLIFWVVFDSVFFFVRNKLGGWRVCLLSEKRVGFCIGSFIVEVLGFRIIVVMEKDESKIDVFFWFKGNFFFIGLSIVICWEIFGY